MRLVLAPVRGILLAGAIAASAPAQAAPSPPPPSAEEQAAFTALQLQRWSEARTAFERLLARDSTNGRLWLRLGLALRGEGRYEDARPVLRRALASGFNAPMAHFGLARVEARLGRPDTAMMHLDHAVRGGVVVPSQLRTDADFATLRGDARFARAEEVADSMRYPCRFRPEHRQLAFWAGDWHVLVGGTVIGRNRIEETNEGCTFVERWEARGGIQVGMSINWFDLRLRKWRQVYVWDMGSTTTYVGERVGNEMRFEGETDATPTGEPVRKRMTLRSVAKDTVVHTADQLQPDGVTWLNVWNATYVRRR